MCHVPHSIRKQSLCALHLIILYHDFKFEPTGHSAVLHGCTVEDEAFVGMGATLLDGVFVEKHAMVAAGALVRQNTRIPYGEVNNLIVSLKF